MPNYLWPFYKLFSDYSIAFIEDFDSCPMGVCSSRLSNLSGLQVSLTIDWP